MLEEKQLQLQTPKTTLAKCWEQLDDIIGSPEEEVIFVCEETTSKQVNPQESTSQFWSIPKQSNKKCHKTNPTGKADTKNITDKTNDDKRNTNFKTANDGIISRDTNTLTDSKLSSVQVSPSFL